MQNRSNQSNEGRNKFRNFVGRDVVRHGAKPTMETWCRQQQLLENEAAGRWREIWKEGQKYKPKYQKCVTLDNLLLHNVREHKKGNLSDDEYFSECVKAIEKTWSAYDEE